MSSRCSFNINCISSFIDQTLLIPENNRFYSVILRPRYIIEIFFPTSVMQPCENLQETVLLWFTYLDHMFVFTFASTLQLINHPFIPANVEAFHSLLNVLWSKVLIKIQPENIPLISYTLLSYPWNQQMDCFDVLASFTLFLFSHQEIILVWQVGRGWKITTIPVLRALAWPISILMEI